VPSRALNIRALHTEPVDANQSKRKECDVTSDLYAKLTMCPCSIASQAAGAAGNAGAAAAALVASPSGPAASAKQTHERFGMTATTINVWPLSPQDWSTG